MSNINEVDDLIERTKNVIRAIQKVRPQSKILIESTQMLLSQEIDRGARKSYLSRLYKSTINDAKELFSPQQFLAFQAELGDTGESPTFAIEEALAKGEIASAAAFHAVMSELDRFLSERSELSPQEEEKVAAVNKLLAEFESRKK